MPPVPQLVDVCDLRFATAGSAVAEAGQRGTDLRPFGGHRALDGFPQLEEEEERKGLGRMARPGQGTP